MDSSFLSFVPTLGSSSVPPKANPILLFDRVTVSFPFQSHFAAWGILPVMIQVFGQKKEKWHISCAVLLLRTHFCFCSVAYGTSHGWIQHRPVINHITRTGVAVEAKAIQDYLDADGGSVRRLSFIRLNRLSM